MKELVGTRIFFFSHWPVVQAIFRAVYALFYRRLCCMMFFYYKGFAGIFSQIPPPAPQRSNGSALRLQKYRRIL